MQQNNVIKNILYLAILTTTVVITWIASNVWYSLVTPTTPEDTSRYSTPITPSFDFETLEQLGNRIQVPIDLTQQGDYVTDSREQEVGSSSGELSDPDSISEPQPIQEEVVIEESIPESETVQTPPPDSNQSISPTPDGTL